MFFLGSKYPFTKGNNFYDFDFALTLKNAKQKLQQRTFINIFHCFSEKIRHGVSSESSARQRIHMKNQALISSKDKSKKLKCRPLQFLFGIFKG